MRANRPLVAFLLLLGWLFATGHVALDHGGVADDHAHHALANCGQDAEHDDGPAHDGHHHHLSALADAQSLKLAQHKALAPGWLPLCDSFVEKMAAMMRRANAACASKGREESPPDERASGWLLVCRSALPVRGPSLAV